MSFLNKQNESDQSSDKRTPVSQDSHKNVNTVHYGKPLTAPKVLLPTKINHSDVRYGTHLKPPPASYKLTNTSGVTIPGKVLTATKVLTPTKINSFDAKGNFPEKPSTSSSTLAKKLKPAFVYIFNQENFDTANEARHGSAQDVAALVKTFDQLKCKVQVIKDATVAKIKSTVQILESKSFEEQSALVIVILTHGGRNDKLEAKDSDYSLDDVVIFPILRNQTLINKPKLFFIQACKGNIKLDSLKTDNVQHGTPNDILKCYSTYEGYVSFRDKNNGTPYIQTLCETLQKSGRTKDIMAIMTEVCDAVKRNTNNCQIPSFTTTMNSKYVFGDYM